MTIEKFLSEEKISLDNFRLWWYANKARNPREFTENMTFTDWQELHNVFEDETFIQNQSE